MEPNPKKSSRAVVVVVVLVVGGLGLLFCGGVVAAIAIPSFAKFQHRSIASEAAMNTRAIAMHAQSTFIETCAFPPALSPTADASTCCGGARCASVIPPELSSAVPGLGGPLRFVYSAAPKGDIYEIVATADFSCGGPQHTVTVQVTGTRTGDSCDATVGSPVTTNELE